MQNKEIKELNKINQAARAPRSSIFFLNLQTGWKMKTWQCDWRNQECGEIAVNSYCWFSVQSMCLDSMEWYWSNKTSMEYPECIRTIGTIIHSAIFILSPAKFYQHQCVCIEWHRYMSIISSWSRRFTSRYFCVPTIAADVHVATCCYWFNRYTS